MSYCNKINEEIESFKNSFMPSDLARGHMASDKQIRFLKLLGEPKGNLFPLTSLQASWMIQKRLKQN